MTIDTIKNVLLRILSINKNLNEDSLHNLLVASGWDESDIKEGMNIFRSYKMSGGDSDSVSDYKVSSANIKSSELNIEQAQNSNNLKKVIDYKVLDGKDLTEGNGTLVGAVENTNTVSLLDTHVPFIPSVQASIESVSNIMPQPINPEVGTNISISSAQNSVPVITTPMNLIAHQSHLDSGELDAYNKREGKPIFLVILDVVLFLITLGLLIYILLS